MATKIYKLNQKKNSAVFQLASNGGKMVVTYTFKDGNMFLPNTPARCTLRDEFYQLLLEDSPLFKNGIIKLERVIDENGKKVEAKAPKKELVDDVTSPEQAIEYVFSHYGVVVKNGKQAVKIAAQKGVEFPNLTEK